MEKENLEKHVISAYILLQVYLFFARSYTNIVWNFLIHPKQQQRKPTSYIKVSLVQRYIQYTFLYIDVTINEKRKKNYFALWNTGNSYTSCTRIYNRYIQYTIHYMFCIPYLFLFFFLVMLCTLYMYNCTYLYVVYKVFIYRCKVLQNDIGDIEFFLIIQTVYERARKHLKKTKIKENWRKNLRKFSFYTFIIRIFSCTVGSISINFICYCKKKIVLCIIYRTTMSTALLVSMWWCAFLQKKKN